MAINNPYIPGDPYSYDLKWIVEKLKEAIALYQPLHDEFEALSDDFDDLGDDFQDLKNFVTNYFDNLDLTTEVQNIINEMEADGYFDLLVQAIIQNDAGIQAYVTAWLDQHVNPVGSAVTIDDTLTTAGSAADALVTGRRTNDLKTEQTHKTLFNGLYKVGFYGTADGVYNPLRTDYYCTEQTFDVDDFLLISTANIRNATDVIYAAWYDNSMTYISSTSFSASLEVLYLKPPAGATKVRISMHYLNSFTWADAPSLMIFKDYAYFDREDYLEITRSDMGMPFITLEPLYVNIVNFNVQTNPSNPSDAEYMTRFSFIRPILAERDIQISTLGDLKMLVSFFSGPTAEAATSLGYINAWLNDVYIKEGSYFLIIFARAGYPLITKDYLINNIKIRPVNDPYTYGYKGEHINTKRGVEFCKNTWKIPTALGEINRQGMAYKNGNLFICYGDNTGVCGVIDYATGTLLSDYSITGNHPNSVAFGAYDDPSDPYPMLFVSSWNVNINHVYINKVDLNGATLLATLTLPQSDAGYYACGAVDVEHDLFIASGYTQPSATDPTGNNVVISVWDLNNMTLIGGEYYPALVKKFVIPDFYGAMQDRMIYDEKLFILNGLPSNGISNHIHVIDYHNEKAITDFDSMPAYLGANEPQGLTDLPLDKETRFIISYNTDTFEMMLN